MYLSHIQDHLSHIGKAEQVARKQKVIVLTCYRKAWNDKIVRVAPQYSYYHHSHICLSQSLVSTEQRSADTGKTAKRVVQSSYPFS
jgi:hypothetical protein